MIAISKGDIEICKLLIDKGADINLQDDSKKTALHISVQMESIDIVKLLIQAGADLDIRG